MVTVVMKHHKGLQCDIGPAAKSIESDSAPDKKRMSEGSWDLPTVPGRVAAKNIAETEKFYLEEEGEVFSKKKKRVTTDDSIEVEDYPSGQSTDSRNSAMFRED